MNYPNAKDLWNMNSSEFNKWRAKNDLPILFDYFHETLPEFDIWLKTLQITVQDMYLTLNLGAFFYGKNEKIVINHKDTNGADQNFCIEKKELHSQRWKNIKNHFFERKTFVISTFTPYFEWIKKRTKNKNPILWDKINKSYTDQFFFGGYRNIPPNSRTHIWRGPELLKLGEVSLPEYADLSKRNLDFTDLDGLTLSKATASALNVISYSSLRFLSIKSTEQAFFTFNYCNFDNTKISNSRLQDFHFFNCRMGDFYLSDTKVYKLSFANCNVLPFIENSHLRDLIKVSSRRDDVTIEETYRLLKNAYNSTGQRKYAADFFYKEQVTHRKNLFHARTFYKYEEDYPPRLTESWTRVLKEITTKHRWNLLSKNLLYLFEFIKKPKYLFNYFRHKIEWCYSLFDWILWGYGVKPHRIALSALTVILFFAIIYNFFGNEISSNTDLKSFIDYFYFSMITFTTLGYGDVYPKTTFLRLLCGTEAFLGAFMMGLVVAGFSNKKTD
ncbi:potassium channel family protein [Acinetobacter bereziniae]|uniref:potassium channel family protein n=1 Tax=Acinetobacter bereziniae TaxID=106648 RepID=UPI002FDB5DD7